MSKRVDQQTTAKLPAIKTAVKAKATPVAIATATAIALVLCAICLATCTSAQTPAPANTHPAQNTAQLAKETNKDKDYANTTAAGEESNIYGTSGDETQRSEEPGQANDPQDKGASAPTNTPEQTQAQAQDVGHTHNWTDKTERNWIEDSPAYDEPVYETYYEQRRVGTKAVCNGCGAEAGTGAEMSAHMKQTGCVGYHTEGVFESVPVTVQTGTVHHDATGHWDVRTFSACDSCGAVR